MLTFGREFSECLMRLNCSKNSLLDAIDKVCSLGAHCGRFFTKFHISSGVIRSGRAVWHRAFERRTSKNKVHIFRLLMQKRTAPFRRPKLSEFTMVITLSNSRNPISSNSIQSRLYPMSRSILLFYQKF